MYLLPILTLVAIYWQYQKKNNGVFGPVSYLISAYLIMALSFFILHFSGLFKSVFDYKIEPMVYLSFSFLIVFWGFVNYRDEKINAISIENNFVYNVLEKLIMVGGFMAILFFSRFAIDHFLSGDIENERLNVGDFATKTLGSFGLLNSFLSLFSNFFTLAILFGFINLIRKKKRSAYLLFISSTSYIVYVFAYVGRDGFVYWTMTFLFFYFLFRKFLNSDTRKKLIRSFSIAIIIALIPFLLITAARFSGDSPNVIMNMFSYGGQQIINFNDRYQVDAQITYGRGSFPIFIDALENIGFQIPNPKIDDINAIYLDADIKPWTFGTYISSFNMNFGKLGTIVLLVILSSISRKLINKNVERGRFSLSDLILFTLLFQFVLWGVFYFRFYSANFYILGVIIIYLILKISVNEKILVLKSLVNFNSKIKYGFRYRWFQYSRRGRFNPFKGTSLQFRKN